MVPLHYLPKKFKCNFLVLIPKKGGVEELKDFRSINLVRVLCKFFAEVLDVVLITNETINLRLKSSNNGVICKIDIEKTYNHKLGFLNLDVDS